MAFKNIEAKRAYQRAWARRQRELNPERYRINDARYKERNREKVRAKNRERSREYRANLTPEQREELASYMRQYRARHLRQLQVKKLDNYRRRRSEILAKAKAYYLRIHSNPGYKKRAADRARRARALLKPHYVRRVLTQAVKTGSHPIPDSLIEAKRLHLQVQRLIKERK